MWSWQRQVGRAALALAVALSAAGCAGASDPGEAETTATADAAQPTPSDSSAPATPSVDDTPSSAAPSGTATDAPDPGPADTPEDGPTDAPEPDAPDAPDTPDEQSLAGTPIDMFWRVGDVLAVVGVAVDDVLNVRAGPGVDQPIVGTLGPLTMDVEIVGETRLLRPGGFWAEVDADSTTGWVNLRYLAWIGPTDDATSRLLPMLPDGGRAETMLALGEAVGEARIAHVTETGSRVVVVDGPHTGDLGEITVDAIGLADDASVGVRLKVFGQPDESGDGFVLKSVEETDLCGRGVSEANGYCR